MTKEHQTEQLPTIKAKNTSQKWSRADKIAFWSLQVNLILAIGTFLLYHTAIHDSRTAEQSVKAANEALSETRKEFSIINQPIIELKNFQIDRRFIEFQFDVSNSGKGPAKIVNCKSALTIDTGLLPKPLGSPLNYKGRPYTDTDLWKLSIHGNSHWIDIITVYNVYLANGATTVGHTSLDNDDFGVLYDKFKTGESYITLRGYCNYIDLGSNETYVLVFEYVVQVISDKFTSKPILKTSVFQNDIYKTATKG